MLAPADLAFFEDTLDFVESARDADRVLDAKGALPYAQAELEREYWVSPWFTR